jgi:hypothetical protein
MIEHRQDCHHCHASSSTRSWFRLLSAALPYGRGRARRGVPPVVVVQDHAVLWTYMACGGQQPQWMPGGAGASSSSCSWRRASPCSPRDTLSHADHPSWRFPGNGSGSAEEDTCCPCPRHHPCLAMHACQPYSLSWERRHTQQKDARPWRSRAIYMARNPTLLLSRRALADSVMVVGSVLG